MASRSAPQRRKVASLLLAGMLVILAIGTIPRALADDIDINVDVLGTTSSATPVETTTATATATATATTTGPGTGGTSATASGTTSTGNPTPTVGPGGETSIGGVLFISGLTMSYTPSINPLDGRVDLRFTVRNAYTKSLDGRATFWVTTWFGNRVGKQVEVVVPDIKPGEIREIKAAIRGVGQWGVLNGHATFVPPKSLDEVTLNAVTRTGTIVYIPWFAVLTCAGGWALYLTRHRRREWFELIMGRGARR